MNSVEDFRPINPVYSIKFINSVQISDLFEQYEKIYPKSKFMGCSAIDTINKDLSALDDLKSKNINGLIYVINIDKSSGPGIRWISLYVDSNKNNIYLFDPYLPSSYSKCIYPEINNFIKTINKYFVNWKNIPIEVIENNECYDGDNSYIFSILVVINLMKGLTFEASTLNLHNS